MSLGGGNSFSITIKKTKMAKKRKKTATRRRRRVGAMALNANSTLMKFAPVIAGFFFADKINPMIDKLTGGKLDPKLVGVGQAGLGALLVFGKGKKSMLKTLGGGLLLGTGAKRLTQSLGVGRIGGYSNVPVLGNRVNGYHSVPVLGNRSVGAYTPNSSVGAYNANPKPFMVMSGVGDNGGSGSGLTSSGSDCMQ